jgi:hypothetical protein
MRRRSTRFSMLLVAFVLVTQLAAFAPVTQAMECGGGTSQAQARPMQRTPTRQADADGCRLKCRREYRRCLRLAGNNLRRKRACYIRYKNCMMRCG